MAKEAPKNDDKTPEEVKPKGKGKKRLLVIIAALTVLVVAGAAGALLLARQGGGEHGEAKADKAPLFVNLEPFTVNLQPENGEQYLQVVTTLKITDKSVEERIKTYMPEMRHRILLLLSGKKPSDIGTPEGRELLADEIRDEANRILGGSGGRTIKASAPVKPIGTASPKSTDNARAAAVAGPIAGVLFTSFIVQ